MRVLHVGKFCPPVKGGMETFIVDLLKYLSRSIDVDLLCVREDLRDRVIHTPFYTIYGLGRISNILSCPITLNLYGWLKALIPHYSILHVHLPHPLATLACILDNSHIPIVVHWHSDVVRQQMFSPMYEWMVTKLLDKASAVIATSPHYVKGSQLLNRFIDKVHVIPLGVDPHRIEATKEGVEKIKATFRDRPIILTVGRLVYYKGFEYLIQAMRYVDAYLIIIGIGPYYRRLERLIRYHKLESRVKLLGYVPSETLGNYYAACDLFVLPSIERSEAFGIVQVEAMYHGKPVISTDIPYSGVTWVNEHNVTGWVVPPRNPKALADAIRYLLNDVALSKRLGENGRRKFGQCFHIKYVASYIYKIYEDITANK